MSLTPQQFIAKWQAAHLKETASAQEHFIDLCQDARVLHSHKIHVMGNVHTNTLEGFWSLVKNGIKGVYHHVGTDYLQHYLNEYAFRYNHRNDTTPMFLTFLCRVGVAVGG